MAMKVLSIIVAQMKRDFQVYLNTSKFFVIQTIENFSLKVSVISPYDKIGTIVLSADFRQFANILACVLSKVVLVMSSVLSLN